MSRSRRPSRRPTPGELRILSDARARALADYRSPERQGERLRAALAAQARENDDVA